MFSARGRGPGRSREKRKKIASDEVAEGCGVAAGRVVMSTQDCRLRGENMWRKWVFVGYCLFVCLFSKCKGSHESMLVT